VSTPEEEGNAIAVDKSGNAINGYTTSPDFPTAMPVQQAYAGQSLTTGTFTGGAFVTELNATGAAMVFSTYLGGSEPDVGNGIAVDSAGNAYVTGTTVSTDFPVTSGAFMTAFGGDASVSFSCDGHRPAPMLS
jgi:Beta-propeller repeat